MGLYEVSEIAHRTRQRPAIVEKFERLVREDETLELQDIHRILEHNVWLLGDQYELTKSNTTLRSIVEHVIGAESQGDWARPDLLLAVPLGRYLLGELKRPSHRIDGDDVAQVRKYRGEIGQYYPGDQIDTVAIGRRVDRGLLLDDRVECRVTTFSEILAETRQWLDWLVSHLTTSSSLDGEEGTHQLTTSTTGSTIEQAR